VGLANHQLQHFSLSVMCLLISKAQYLTRYIEIDFSILNGEPKTALLQNIRVFAMLVS
jgi:hypothetical protein